MNSYALYNSRNSVDRMGIGIFCFFSWIINPHFAGDRNYCDIAPPDQGRQSSLTINK